jgi:Glycine zipper
MMRKRWTRLLGGLVLLGGCATLPTGPSVMVLPAAGKPFEQFQAEEAGCREWAAQQSGAVPGAPANQQTAVGAAIGTAVGAGLGAAIGSASGHAGTGAAIGAGTGLLMGTAAGANADQVAGGNAQRRYDMAYQQCMYAKGNQIPGAMGETRRGYGPPPLPPPPPGFGSPPPVPSSAIPPPPPPPPSRPPAQ